TEQVQRRRVQHLNLRLGEPPGLVAAAFGGSGRLAHFANSRKAFRCVRMNSRASSIALAKSGSKGVALSPSGVLDTKRLSPSFTAIASATDFGMMNPREPPNRRTLVISVMAWPRWRLVGRRLRRVVSAARR